MRNALFRIAIVGTLAALAGCVVYDAPPGYYATSPSPSVFDRSWSAASGALRDQGVQVSREDRSSGVIEGQAGAARVSARVFTQADGNVRVEFNTSDSALAQRISNAYEARMGR
jgi:hypothetical protein